MGEGRSDRNLYAQVGAARRRNQGGDWASAPTLGSKCRDLPGREARGGGGTPAVDRGGGSGGTGDPGTKFWDSLEGENSGSSHTSTLCLCDGTVFAFGDNCCGQLGWEIATTNMYPFYFPRIFLLQECRQNCGRRKNFGLLCLHWELSPTKGVIGWIFSKKIPVQKNPIVLTGYKRCSDIRFPPNQIEQSPGGPNENGRKVHPPKAKSKSRFWMVIVCSGFHHRRRIGDFFVELSFQCREAYDKTNTLFVCNNTNNVTRNTPKPKRRGNKLEESRIESPNWPSWFSPFRFRRVT